MVNEPRSRFHVVAFVTTRFEIDVDARDSADAAVALGDMIRSGELWPAVDRTELGITDLRVQRCDDEADGVTQMDAQLLDKQPPP